MEIEYSNSHPPVSCNIANLNLEEFEST
jgi:hypothetical protein